MQSVKPTGGEEEWSERFGMGAKPKYKKETGDVGIVDSERAGERGDV
jgi:hypothetical protein